MVTLKVFFGTTVVWTETGDKGNTWFSTMVDLNAFAGSLSVAKFVGASGSSYTGDTAIDNVSFVEVATAPTCAPTVPTPPPTSTPTPPTEAPTS